MSRRPARKRSGIRMPATVALLCAAALLIGHRMGGDAQVDALLDAIAQNRTFITSSIALETGVSAPKSDTAPAASAQDTEETAQTAAESAPPPQPAASDAPVAADSPALPTAQATRVTPISTYAMNPIQRSRPTPC